MGWRDRRKTMTPSLCWLPLLLYAGFIFSLSSRSFHGAEISFKADYFHLVEFCTLGLFLCCFWEPMLGRRNGFVFYACVVVSGLLYGVADEFHQSYVPGRDADVWDVLYDAVGLSIGCGIYLLGKSVHGRLSRRIGPPGGGDRRKAAGSVGEVPPPAPIKS